MFLFVSAKIHLFLHTLITNLYEKNINLYDFTDLLLCILKEMYYFCNQIVQFCNFRRMPNAKSITYFSVANVDLREVAGLESHVFKNDDISIVLNGSPSDSPFLHAGKIYHIPEPRLLIVMSGNADVHLNLEQYHFEKGSVVVSTSDMIMEFGRCSDDMIISGIVFKDQLHVGETFVVNTTPKEYEQLLRMLYILWDIANEKPFRRETVKQMVSAMITNVQYMKQESVSSEPLPTRGQLLFQQFKSLVSQHCEHERNIPFYAGQLHVTPHHLSAVISKASGHSVMYWINRAALLRAKVLLKTTDLMTYEIAERLNFPSSPAFNSFFKRETGLTPREYRAER